MARKQRIKPVKKPVVRHQPGERPVLQQLDKGCFVNELVVDEDTGRTVRRYRNLGGWPPAMLHERYGSIDANQYEACKKFAYQFHLAGMMPRVSLSALPGGGGREMSDRMAEALKDWGDAYRAIHGVSGKRIAVDVICHGYTPSDLLKTPMPGEVMQFTRLEREKIFRTRDAVIGRFIEACSDLAGHYGFTY